MPTKLTLRLDEDLITSAKEYSAKSGKSVSRIVADLFEIIKNEKLEGGSHMTPVTRSLRGIISNETVAEKDYKSHLVDKYL